MLSFILTIILSSVFFANCLSMNFYKFENRVFSNSKFYEYVKGALKNKKNGFATIVVLKDSKDSLSVKHYLEKNGMDLEKNRVAINTEQEGLFFLYSGDNKLAFVFGSNLKDGFWTEKSVETKRKGLLLDKEFLKLIKNHEKIGNLAISKDFIVKLWDFFWILNYQLMYLNRFLILMYVIIVIFSAIGAVVFLSKPDRKYNRFFLRFIPASIILGYIFVIYSPLLILKVNNIFLFLLIFFLTVIITSCFDLKISQLVCALFGIFSILGQAFLMDNILQLLSTAGYHPSLANRFYGIGNEFFAYLMGFVFVLSVVSNMSFRNLFATLFLVALVLVIPYYGVNFGAFFSVVAGIAVFAFIKEKHKIKTLAVIFAFIPLAMVLILKNSYIYNAFANYSTFVSILKRKMLMNLSYLFRYPLTIPVLLSFVILLWIVIQNRFDILPSVKAHKDKFVLFFIIGLFSFLVNDSGTIIIALLMGFFVLGIYYTKMVDGYGVR